MKLISISGLDGSGKSTQIEMLKSYLESQGKKVFYFHAIQFGLATKLSEFKRKYCLICKIMKRCQVAKPKKSVIRSGRLGIWLRKIFLKVDLWRFQKLSKKLEQAGYDYIVSDRYFYDSIINIEYLTNKCHPEFISGSNLENQEMLKHDSHAASRGVQHDNIVSPDVAIYLQTDPKIIMQRERKPDQGLEYLKQKKELYDSYSIIWNLKIINGNRNKEEIFEEIKKFIKL